MKKKVLVTGAMGFVGQYWCKKLFKEGHTVYGVDIKPLKKKFSNPNFKFYKTSVFNFALLKKLIKRSDIVCHFAGIAEPKQYLKRPVKVIDLTITPSFEIVRLCTKYKKKLIFTSTSEVYGKSDKIPFSETDDRVLGSTDKKRWCYSTAKSMVEHFIIANNYQNNLNYIIFRLFNVYGPDIYGRVVDEFIKRAKSNKSLIINGDGKQTRSFLYIDDCIEAFYKVIFKKKLNNEIFNIGNNAEVSINEFAKIVIKIANSKSKIKKNSNQMKKLGGYEDIRRRVPKIQKLKKNINWKPKTNLEKGLKKMMD